MPLRGNELCSPELVDLGEAPEQNTRCTVEVLGEGNWAGSTSLEHAPALPLSRTQIGGGYPCPSGVHAVAGSQPHPLPPNKPPAALSCSSPGL